MCSLCAPATPHQLEILYFVLSSFIADILFVRAGAEARGMAVGTALGIIHIHQTAPCSLAPFTRDSSSRCAHEHGTLEHGTGASVSSEKYDCSTTQILHYYAVAASAGCVILSWHVYIIFYLMRISPHFLLFSFLSFDERAQRNFIILNNNENDEMSENTRKAKIKTRNSRTRFWRQRC